MIFYSSAKKKVTKEEMDSIQRRLHSLSSIRRREIEQLFRGDLYELGEEEGITREEFEAALVWLNENSDKHTLRESDIALMTRYFNEALKD